MYQYVIYLFKLLCLTCAIPTTKYNDTFADRYRWRGKEYINYQRKQFVKVTFQIQLLEPANVSVPVLSIVYTFR